MTKKEIANAIAEETNLTQVVAKDIMQRLFDGIIDTLEKERRIELRGVGVGVRKGNAERALVDVLVVETFDDRRLVRGTNL